MSIFTAAFSLFLVYNVLGYLPFYIGLLKPYSEKRQRIILVREMFIALGILFLFGYFGDTILRFLGIGEGIIGIAGGILLLIIALTMVFPKHSPEEAIVHTSEPLIVPIATPGMAGPGSITAVMLYGSQMSASWKIALIIFLAWIPSLIILLLASQIKRLVGDRGLTAFERFGGLLMCLISVQMIAGGVIQQVKKNFHCPEKPKQELTSK